MDQKGEEQSCFPPAKLWYFKAITDGLHSGGWHAKYLKSSTRELHTLEDMKLRQSSFVCENRQICFHCEWWPLCLPVSWSRTPKAEMLRWLHFFLGSSLLTFRYRQKTYSSVKNGQCEFQAVLWVCLVCIPHKDCSQEELEWDSPSGCSQLRMSRITNRTKLLFQTFNNAMQ